MSSFCTVFPTSVTVQGDVVPCGSNILLHYNSYRYVNIILYTAYNVECTARVNLTPTRRRANKILIGNKTTTRGNPMVILYYSFFAHASVVVWIKYHFRTYGHLRLVKSFSRPRSTVLFNWTSGTVVALLILWLCVYLYIYIYYIFLFFSPRHNW